MTTSLRVLFEDNHCLAVEKPAGLLTMGDRTGKPSLVDAARDYLKQKYAKPGNVFVGVVHRVDRPVSGVVLFARTSKAASRLSEQFRLRSVEKTYLALVEGTVPQRADVLFDWLLKDPTRNETQVVDSEEHGARACVLGYRRLERLGRFTLLELQPQTGRSHQIRVQLASRGWPIVGDRKYGAQTPAKGFIALHAASLMFAHPVTKKLMTVSSDWPEAWQSLGLAR